MLWVLWKTLRNMFISRSADIYHWWVFIWQSESFNSSLLLRRDEGIIPFTSPLFVPNHFSDAYCYTNYSNTPLRQFIHQKGADNLELISRRNQRVWSQEERRESQNRERTAGKIEPSGGLRSGWNHNLKHFFSIHMFPCVAYEGVRWAVS